MWCMIRGGAKVHVRFGRSGYNENWQGVPAEFFAVLLNNYYGVMNGNFNRVNRLKI